MSSAESENIPMFLVGSFDPPATSANIIEISKILTTDTVRQIRSISQKLFFKEKPLYLCIRKTSKYANRAYSEAISFITSSYRRG
jgi:hypothetical protein